MTMETPREVFVCRHDVEEKAIVAFIEAYRGIDHHKESR